MPIENAYEFYMFKANPTTSAYEELGDKMKQITFEQASKYRPGMFGINVDVVDAHDLPVLSKMTFDQIKVMYFLDAWCWFNGTRYYDDYFDSAKGHVILCRKNQRYVEVL